MIIFLFFSLDLCIAVGYQNILGSKQPTRRYFLRRYKTDKNIRSGKIPHSG